MSIGYGCLPRALLFGRMVERHASPSSISSRIIAHRLGTPRLSGIRLEEQIFRPHLVRLGLRVTTDQLQRVDAERRKRARRAVWSSSRNGFGRFLTRGSSGTLNTSGMRAFCLDYWRCPVVEGAQSLLFKGGQKKTRQGVTAQRVRPPILIGWPW
jgi:hypothetical protein